MRPNGDDPDNEGEDEDDRYNRGETMMLMR